jgi:protein-disulfide isomerase
LVVRAADFNGGIRSGVNETPTFFINGSRYDGGPAFDELSEALRALL